jgi:transcriptional regulator with XRE-family HTH domain
MTGPSLLDAYLRTHNVSLRDAGRRVGASAAAVMNWRDGKVPPSTEYLGRLRDEFGIPVDAWVEPPALNDKRPAKGSAKGSAKRGAKRRHGRSIPRPSLRA